MTEVIQLREHACYAHLDPLWTPDVLFSQASSIITIDARTQGVDRLGKAYLFVILNQSLLHNRTLKITWRCVSNVALARDLGYIRIMDGEYSRSSMVDFPVDNVMITKGAGELFSYINHNGIWNKGWNWFETIVTPDLSGATLSKVTLFIELNDAWLAWGTRLYIECIKIYDGASLVWQNDLNDAIVMEVGGTDNDYGNAGGFAPSPIFIEELTITSPLQVPEELGGYFVLGHYIRLPRGRFWKILISDHNIPRLILRKVRDLQSGGT